MEVHEELQDLRQRVLRGEEVSSSDYKKLIDNIREGKTSAAEVKERKTKASNVKEIDPDDIFGSE